MAKKSIYDLFSGAGGLLHEFKVKTENFIINNQIIVIMIVQPFVDKYLPQIADMLIEVVLRFSLWCVL